MHEIDPGLIPRSYKVPQAKSPSNDSAEVRPNPASSGLKANKRTITQGLER